MTERCEDCRYWIRTEAVSFGEEKSYGIARVVHAGSCHRFPPANDRFPLTRDDSWCGEFIHKDVGR